jgi:hypothetical protein
MESIRWLVAHGSVLVDTVGIVAYEGRGSNQLIADVLCGNVCSRA